jgi:outer membrane receptor protein involved in Fe transport
MRRIDPLGKGQKLTSTNSKILGRLGLGASTTTLAIGMAFAATPAFAQSTNAASAPSAAASAPDQNAPATDSGTIVVTGSRISNPNLTALTPVTVVNAAEVKAQGNVRVEDLLNSLPQVMASEGSSDANGASGIATVDLRNLGTARTLVLVNGRRLGAGDPTDLASDLNFIPGSLIKRVDVLTGGASATYGSDALAGVVNFVLNTDFEGVQLDAQTSVYQHDNRYSDTNYNAALAARAYTPPQGNTVDGATKTATATFGASMADGRGHVTAYLSWRSVNAVTQGDRDYSYCSYSAVSSVGGLCGGSSTSAFGRFRRTQPAGVNPATGAPIYGAVGTSYTANPAVASPATGFGTFSSARDAYNFNPTNYYQRPDTRYTAGLFAHYDVNDSFKPYMEFMFMDDHSLAQIAASGAFYGTDFFINCNNPLVSAAQRTQLCTAANIATGGLQSVYIGRRNVEGGGRVNDLRHTDYRAVLGAKGDIADGVTYDVYGSLWKSILAESYLNDFSRIRLNNSLNVVISPTTGQPVCASTLPNAQGQVTDPNCVPYNIFTGTTTVQGNVNQGVTAAALRYLQTPGFQAGSNSEYIVSGTVSVDLGRHGFQSPFSDSGVQAVFGGEYRKEKIVLNRDIEFLTGDLAGQGTPNGVPNVAGGYAVKEGFTEISIPLVTDKPFFQTLGVDVGYRYSSYSIQGTTNTYKISAEWAPIKQIRFRGGYNRAVRAPNSLELFAAPTVQLFSGQDPCASAVGRPTASAAGCALTGLTAAQYAAGGAPYNSAGQYNQQTVGNIALKPEKGDTYTVGAVVNPIRNLTLSADYFNIKVSDTIGSPGANYILSQCIAGNTALCSFIHRSVDGSLFTGTGYVANPTLNLGALKTAGIDVAGTYKLNFGRHSSVLFDMTGTYLTSYQVTQIKGNPSFECKGAFGSYGADSCGQPHNEWRHKLRVTYQITPEFALSGAWRYFSKVTNELIKLEGYGTCPTSTAAGCVNPHDAKIPAVSFFDLSAVASLGDHYTFRIGVQNLLDKQPPVLDTYFTSNGSNTYSRVYDSLGRYIYAAVQLNF